MKTAAYKTKTTTRYCEMVKNMTVAERIELMSILVDSLKSSVHWSLTDDKPLMPPYSMDEIYARIEQSRRDSAVGLGQESEEMFRELEAEFAVDDNDYDY